MNAAWTLAEAVARETAWVLYEASAYVLVGFVVAGLLNEFLSTETISRHLGRSGPRSVLVAALLGAQMPLCSCGVLPAAASLRRKGASPGATLAFLISTPETGVDSIALTYALLGPVMAIVRPLVAVATAVTAGLAWLLTGERGAPPAEADAGPADCCIDDDTDDCSAQPAANEHPTHPRRGVARLRAAMDHGFRTILDEIAFWLVVGLVLTGFAAAALPDDFFSAVLGWDQGLAPMLAMIVAGVPLYLCASASTPVAAALVAKGLSPGAALVFLLVGPATNVATITVVAKLLGRRAVLLYLASIIGVSLAAGLLLERLAPDAVQVVAWGATDDPTCFAWTKTAAAIVLVALLLDSFRRTRFREGVGELRQQGRRLVGWIRGRG